MSEGMNLSVYDRVQNPIEAIEKIGDLFATSGMFGCEKKEHGRILALACMCERKSPFEIMRTYHIVEGKLSMRADAMLARFHELGGLYEWKNSGDDGTEAVLCLSYRGIDHFDVKFTLEEAVKANLCGKDGCRKAGQQRDGGWQKNRGAMLRARVVSKALRMVAPEVVAGTYTPEEIEDFDKPNAPRSAEVIEAEPIAEPTKRGPGRPKKDPQPEQPKPAEAALVVEAKAEPAKPAEQKPAEAPKTEPADKADEPQDAVEIVANAGKVLYEGKEVTFTRANFVAMLIKRGMLKAGQDIKDLAKETCDRILAKPDSAMRAAVIEAAAK